jgi:hypothetical protein
VLLALLSMMRLVLWLLRRCSVLFWFAISTTLCDVCRSLRARWLVFCARFRSILHRFSIDSIEFSMFSVCFEWFGRAMCRVVGVLLAPILMLAHARCHQTAQTLELPRISISHRSTPIVFKISNNLYSVTITMLAIVYSPAVRCVFLS